jgi:hypothetical protein
MRPKGRQGKKEASNPFVSSTITSICTYNVGGRGEGVERGLEQKVEAEEGLGFKLPPRGRKKNFLKPFF